MKKVLIGCLGLVVLAVVAVVVGGIVLVANLGPLVKTGIEKGGTYATGVTTTVGSVDLSLRKGTFAMEGFQMANPPGFDTPHFIALSDTAVSLDEGNTDRKTITLASMTLKGIDLYLDKGKDPSNYNAVLNNLKRFESGEEPAPASESSGPKVVIDSLVIEDVNVHLANMPGVGVVAGDVAVKVPRIELQDVGKDEAMSMGDVIALVVKTVLAASVEAGGGIIPGDVLGELGNGLGSLKSLSDLGITGVGDIGEAINERLGGVSEQAKKAIDEAQKAGEDVQKQVNDAAEKVKGIFGGKKDEEKKDQP